MSADFGLSIRCLDLVGLALNRHRSEAGKIRLPAPLADVSILKPVAPVGSL